MSAILFAIHGYIGAGKTTLATKLENIGAGVTLPQDEWMTMLYGNNPPEHLFAEMYDRVSTLRKMLARKLLLRGVSVIFDDGFWSVKSRGELIDLANSVEAQLILIDLSRLDFDTLWQRVSDRNSRVSTEKNLFIDKNTFDSLKPKFESIGVAEGIQTYSLEQIIERYTISSDDVIDAQIK